MTDIDKKCAPSKKFKDKSCFSHTSLKKIADSYNKRYKTNISLDLSKKELVQELDKKFANQCDEQTCWLKLDVVRALKDTNKEVYDDIKNHTFRPTGPQKKHEWLSTTHINDVLNQYQNVHSDFLFLGAVPVDFQEIPIGINNLNFSELEKEGKSRIGMVINLDEHYKSGSHWVALYTDLIKNQIYYFDSVAKKPAKRIRRFVNKILKYLYNKNFKSKLPLNDIINDLRKNKFNNKHYKDFESKFDIRYNNIQHQFKNSECGVYSINFIARLIEGESFDQITQNITKDDKMNLNREIYFRNVNFSNKYQS